jgi:endonuclease/exonuclease/phosphatase family metal-dependent hydrolase
MTVDLRVLTWNVHCRKDDRAALGAEVRRLEPDIVLVQEAPRRFGWRRGCAHLADSFGMVVVAGGLPSLGNLIVSSLRVRVLDTWCLRYPLTPGRHMRGAAFARCSVGGAEFVVSGSHLATDPVERPQQAAHWKAALCNVTVPLVAAGDEHRHTPTFPAQGPRNRLDAIFVSPAIEVRRHEVVSTDAARRASDHLPVLADLKLPLYNSGG